MSKCERNRDKLVDWIAGTGSLDSFDWDHAAQCSRCREEHAKASSLHRALKLWADEIDAEADRLSAQSILERRPRPLYRRALPWLATAAAVVLAVLILPLVEPEVEPSLLGTYVSSLEAEAARTELVTFLARSQLFLLSLLDHSAADCAQDPGFQRRLANRLIDQKRLLEPKLATEPFGDIRPLLDELEVLLLSVAASEDCIQGEELRQWQGIIEARSTLLRLSLLQLEDRI